MEEGAVLDFQGALGLTQRLQSPRYATGIADNRTALWDSEHCGVWKFNNSAAGFDAATGHDIYDRQKEARAPEYAHNCYGSADLLKSGRCNLFYQPTIKYNREPRWGCPFTVREICVQGQQPLNFYTDLIDRNDIGINSKHLFKFRRNSTCTPLTWEDSYVRNKTAVNGETTYYYEFGSTGHNYNYTYSTTGNPHDWHAPSYVVRYGRHYHPLCSFFLGVITKSFSLGPMVLHRGLNRTLGNLFQN